LIVKRNKRGNSKEIYLGCNLFTENEENTEVEYEIDANKAYKKLKNGIPFSKNIGLVTDPCIALKRKIKLMPNEETTLNLIISVSEDINEVLESLKYYRVVENVKTEFNVSRAKVEEEARYLDLSRNDLETFNMLLPYVIYQNPLKSLYIEDLPKKEYKQSEFWKYGISGDIPIMLVTVKSTDDIYVVKEMLKAHEYFRVKGIKTDLIILDYEKNIYEQYVKDQVIQEILNMQIGYLQNISGGIYLLNKNEIEDEDLFKFRANIIIPASKGCVKDSIKEMEEIYKLKEKNIGNDKQNDIKIANFETIKPNIDFSNLKYYNEYGGFSNDRKRIYNKINQRK